VLNPAYLFGGFPRVLIPQELISEVHFLRHLGVSAAELKKIWWFRSRMYHSFDIAKSGGGTRKISAPNYRLKMLQRKIADLLGRIYKPRKSVHGFVAGRSVKTNAECHVDRSFIVNLDLQEFFPSISDSRVRGLLLALGIDGRVAEIATRICCNEGSLPQGAPSSPIISNMICFKLDKELQKFSKDAKMIYTRYADDITLSCYQPPSSIFETSIPETGRFSSSALAKGLLEIFSSNGFTINDDKCHYADRNSRRIVTGIKVNEFLNVDRRYYRDLRAIFFRIEKDGVAAAQKHLFDKYEKGCKLENHLHGKIEWLGFIKGKSDPIFRKLASKFNHLFGVGGFSLAPTSEEIRDRAIWVIEDLEGVKSQGTVFFLKDVGLVTAAHCIGKDEPFRIFHPSKTSNGFDVGVIKACSRRDVAILSHSVPPNEFYELLVSTETLAVGDDVYSMGFPSFGPGDKLNVRRGTISSQTVKSLVPLVEVTQKHAQGMSGGPVTLSNGSVCGVIHKGGPKEPRDFAVNISALLQLLAE